MLARSRKYDNETLDVVNKGCFDNYDGLACGRDSILTLISLFTFLMIVLKIIKYHKYRHSQIFHYAIFYLSAIECVVCASSFLVGVRYPQLNFTANLFKHLQFILICHLHWSSAARARHRDDVVQHVVNPVLSLYMLYCTTVVLMGMVDIGGTWTECLRPYWLMLSSADFISVQLFAVVALYLTHSNNRSVISTLMLPTASSQTRDLWLVTAVYEVSAVVSVVFDAVMSLLGREETGCSGIYNHVQAYYSTSILVLVILKFFLPTWTLLTVFQPVRVKSRPSEVALTSHYNTDGTCYNQYRRMFFSQNGGHQVSMAYPTTIPSYPSDPPLYEGFVDYSYPDSSSPDLSPTIAMRKGGDMNEAYENYFISFDKRVFNDAAEEANRFNNERIDRNRHNLEMNLNINDKNYYDYHYNIRNDNTVNNSNLTTINEEGGGNNSDSPIEQSVAQQF